jgi:hypothetical protein
VEREEAVVIIKSLVDSIKTQPSQFKFTVNAKAVGQSIVSHGGIGLSVRAVGGGPGSTTIGNKVTVSSGDVNIAVDAADSAINEQMNALVGSLNRIIEQLESSDPNKSRIKDILASLRDTWVPPMISAVVSTIAGLIVI